MEDLLEKDAFFSHKNWFGKFSRNSRKINVWRIDRAFNPANPAPRRNSGELEIGDIDDNESYNEVYIDSIDCQQIPNRVSGECLFIMLCFLHKFLGESDYVLRLKAADDGSGKLIALYERAGFKVTKSYKPGDMTWENFFKVGRHDVEMTLKEVEDDEDEDNGRLSDRIRRMRAQTHLSLLDAIAEAKGFVNFI